MDEFLLAIEMWLDAKEVRSIASLARASGVSESTIRRTLQKETTISLENALKILEVITKDNNPEYTRLYTLLSPGSQPPKAVTKNKKSDGGDFNMIFQSVEAMRIFIQCSTFKGVEESAIKRSYGLRSKTLVDSMVQADAMEHNGTKLRSKTALFKNQENVRATIKMACDISRESDATIHSQSVVTGSISADRLEHFRMRARELIREFDDVDKCGDEIPFIFSINLVSLEKPE